MNADPLEPLLGLSGVAAAVDSTRSAVDGLLANRVLRRRSTDVSAESLLRGAWASATLAGAEFDLEQFRNGEATDAVSQGALRVSVELASLANTPAAANRQVLARLHALAAADLVPAQELGRPRPDREVAHRLDVLAEVLAATRAPALVVAAIIQAEILSLDAFAPASGVVARGAARLAFIQRGLDPNSVVAFEIGHLELRSELAAALDAYRSATPAGIAGWIEHCGHAVELGVRESLAVCEAISRG